MNNRFTPDPNAPIIVAPLSAVIAAANNEATFRLIMPGARGTFSELFGASSVSVDTSTNHVNFSGQHGNEYVSFYEVDSLTTGYKITNNGTDINLELFVSILKNYAIGLKLSESLKAQRKFKRYIIAVTLGLPLVVGGIFAGPMLFTELSNQPFDGSARGQLGTFFTVLFTVTFTGLVFGLFFARVLGNFVKKHFFQRELNQTAAVVSQLLAGSIERLDPPTFAERFPEITKTIQYPYSRNTWSLRAPYTCSTIRIQGFQLSQLRKHQIVWHLPLHSSFAHSYVARHNAPIKKLKRFRLELEGDFQNYFNFYTSPGQHIEALRLATPEVMQAMVDHAQPFDLEVRDNHMYVHSPLKHFFDPFWIARSLTAAQRIAAEIDTRGDKPAPYQSLPQIYQTPLVESPAKLFLVVYGILCGFLTPAWLGLENFFNVDNILMGYFFMIPLLASMLTVLLWLHLTIWYNQYTLGLAGLVTQEGR